MSKIFLILIFLFWGTSLSAQMNLAECVKIALRHNPGLKISETETQLAREDVTQARSAFLPALNFSGAYRRQSEVPALQIPPISTPFGQTISLFPAGGMQLGSLDNFDFKLTLTQPVFARFQLSNRWQATRAIAASKNQELERTRAELIYKVEAAYANVLKAMKFLEIAQSARHQVQAHLRDVENFVAQGLAKKEEALKVQVKLSETELAQMQAENAVQIARLALENIMGQKIAENMQFTTFVSVEDDIPPHAAAVQAALEKRPEIKALEFVQTANTAIKKAARGCYLPALAAFGSLGYGKPGLNFIKSEWMDYWLVGIGAEWNLWNWGQTHSQVQQAQLRLNALAENERQLRDAITLDVTQAELHRTETGKRRQLTQVMAYQAQESFRITENSYRQGQATHTEFFDAQSELTRAQLQQAQAEIDAVLAQLNWRRAVGNNAKYYLE
ncbi:TolC family protein [candidate division KSB1 bacterium]|nr:TolC family protein [candidate division KSB1 bacterium]